MNTTTEPSGTQITFENSLPIDVIINDSFSSDKTTNYFGDLTPLATVAASSSAALTPKHSFASVFIVTHKDTGFPIARFVWLKVRPKKSFNIGQADVDAINQALAFIEFLSKSPNDPVAKSFLALIADTSSATLTQDVDSFFAKQADYKLVTFVTYMLGVTSIAQNPPPAEPQPGQQPDPSKQPDPSQPGKPPSQPGTTPAPTQPGGQPTYSLSRLVMLMGGSWPSGFPDIAVQKFKVQDEDGSITFWAEVDLKNLPAVGLGPIAYFTKLLGNEKVLFSIMFHYGFDAEITGTRLMLRFDDIAIPLDGSTKLKINQPTITIDINPLFKFVVFGIKGTVPFKIFGKSFDAIATMTIDNVEAAVGLVIQGDHTTLPSPPQLPGMHFDEYGAGMGIIFEPPSYVLGLEGKFHIGGGQSNIIALDDDTFTMVLAIEDEVPDPLYLSFYVPKLTLDDVLALYTNTRTGIDVPVHFTDLAFVWAENPMEPLILPDGTLSDAALRFRATVDILSFGFYGDVEVDISAGLTADVEVSPISLGPFKLSGDGKGVTIKVDEHGSPIKNNAIRDRKTLQDVLKHATDKVMVRPGGPVLRIQSLSAPFLHLNAKASLFDLVSEAITADIDKSGMRFELNFGSVLSETMKVKLADFHNLDGMFSFGIDRTIHFPSVGPVSLGSIHLKSSVAVTLKIRTSASDVTLSAGGTFDFERLHLTLPEFRVNAHIEKITDLLSVLGDEIEHEARQIFGSVLSDAATWAKWVAARLITGIEDMAPVLKDAFNKTLNGAAIIMHDVGVNPVAVAHGLRDAYKVSGAAVAGAMKGANYSAYEVGSGVLQAYGLSEQGLAQAMKGANYIASDVGGVLKNQFGGDINNAASALAGAGYGAEAVGGALKGTFADSAGQAAQALKGAGYGAAQVGSALKGTFTNSAEEAAAALKAANFPADQVAGVAKNVFGASTQVAAQILNTFGVAGDEANRILGSIGCPPSEIGSALNSVFHWSPHINFPHVNLPHLKISHFKIW